MLEIKLKYFFLMTLVTFLNTFTIGQNEKIKPVIGPDNLWGYRDLGNNIVVTPIFDNVTPLVSNFYEVEPKQLNVKDLLRYTGEITFFRNPIGIVIKSDSLGIVDHQGKFLLNPMKCKLRTIYQESEMKFVENLEEESDDYGKIALISQSGLFISPFIMCQVEDYEVHNPNHHQYYYRQQELENLLLLGCKESYNMFINQKDGFIKQVPDSIYFTLATDGYYFVENTQKQKIDLFHNDTHIKSIDMPEKYGGLTYFTKGIFSLTNDTNIILMDTSGRAFYTIENGYLEGINDHGHARIGQNRRIIYIDAKGKQIFETSASESFFSNKDGYHFRQEDSIIYFDKNFNKIASVATESEENYNPNSQINGELFFSLCQDSFYFLELTKKKIYNFRSIKMYEYENGKYNIIEFEFENGHYFYSKCGKEPFFIYDGVYDFKYIGNDIFFIYIGNDVIVYHYLNGELGKFGNGKLNPLTFQGKKYFYSKDYDTGDINIYDQSFKKLNGNYDHSYKNFYATYNGIECGIFPFIENGRLLFEIFGFKGVMNLENLDPNFALKNVALWHHKNMVDSYSVYMGIRDTFSFHIVELNFSNIIENPQDYKVYQFLLEFDPLHTTQTKQNFLDRKNLAQATILDSLICVMLTDEKSICLDLNKRANIQIDNTVLYPETHTYYYNRRVKIDCYDLGYIDKEGRQVIPLIYSKNDYWTSFKYGVAIAMKYKNVDSSERLFCLIDTMGRLLIPLSDCELKFDHLGKIIVKKCRNSDDGFSKFYFYDLKGNFLDDFEYGDNGNNYLYASLHSGGSRVFTGDINSYVDVDDAVVKNDQLWVKKDGKEYTFNGSELVPVSLPLLRLNKQRHYFLTREITIQIEDDLLTFVEKNKTPISSVVGSIYKIDYENGFVYIEDKYRCILVYSFIGEKLFEAKHFDVEYFPKYKFFIHHRFDDIKQRSIYHYHYIH
ncbi:MAG: hypothetical protein IPM42_08060 [Saprospiraceae bacterium]|nr:hypothetical protein [Saprospiraceae bacterium]